MMIPAQAKAMTQPAEPDIAISSPEVMKRPMPIVPENAIATRCCVRTYAKSMGHGSCTYQICGAYQVPYLSSPS
jgi:hypothetical protein